MTCTSTFQYSESFPTKENLIMYLPLTLKLIFCKSKLSPTPVAFT